MDILSVKILFILLYVVVFLTCIIGETRAEASIVNDICEKYR